MPETSKRGQIMPASPIRKLVPLANKAKERGVKVYQLNIGQPDLPTPQAGLDALKHIDRKVLEYSPSEGLRSLRDKTRRLLPPLQHRRGHRRHHRHHRRL